MIHLLPHTTDPARTRIGLTRGAALVLLILAVGCADDPVSEMVDIEIISDEEAVVTVSVGIEDFNQSRRPATAARVGSFSRALEDGTDDWSRRFDAVEPAREERTLIREKGVLRRVRHSGTMEPGELGVFFGDSAISVFVSGGSGWRELAIYPGTPNRASVEQKQWLERRTGVLLGSIERYYRTVANIYRYVDLHPHRARAIFTTMFEDEVPLADSERLLIDEFVVALEELIDILTVGEDDALSLRRVSYLVYDPLPADIRVRVPGQMLLHEGFEESDDESFLLSRFGLWEAFIALEGRWITPDPLTFIRTEVEEEMRETSEDEPPPDPNADPIGEFLQQPRRVDHIPSPAEMREALLAELAPRPVYRVRWVPEP